MRLRLTLSILALAAAAVPAGSAAAQVAVPAPSTCYQCIYESPAGGGQGYFNCIGGYKSGGTGCRFSENNQKCELITPCRVAEATSADAQAASSDIAALLSDEAPLPVTLVRVATDGQVQLRSRCAGAVLARAYSPARAAELRRASETLTL